MTTIKEIHDAVQASALSGEDKKDVLDELLFHTEALFAYYDLTVMTEAGRQDPDGYTYEYTEMLIRAYQERCEDACRKIDKMCHALGLTPFRGERTVEETCAMFADEASSGLSQVMDMLAERRRDNG